MFVDASAIVAILTREADADELARLATCEQGKPLAEAAVEVGGAVYFLRHYAAVDLPVEVVEDSPVRRVELHRAPLGVVAAIVPWNFPVLNAVSKLAAAMLVGNTVVVKPAPTTPLATARMLALFEAIVPAGVLNLVVDDNDLGPHLTAHPKVRMISFTGSTATGAKVMASGAADLKRVTLELGGNDPGIVLDDVDPRTVAPQLFGSAFMNNGQVCIAMKRVYVPERHYDAVCEALGELARHAVVGPGLQQGVQLGPVQNRNQYDKLKALIEDSRAHGSIVAGGEVPDGSGYFIYPTIVRDLPDDAALVKEEQFGPVLPVLSYRELDEVIARANDSPYGLGASVWSNDLKKAAEVAARLDAGTVWINKHGDVTPETPFAGAKMSGVGVEFGLLGLHDLTQVKVVNYARTSCETEVGAG